MAPSIDLGSQSNRNRNNAQQNDAKGGDTKKKCIGKMQRVFNERQGMMRDFMVSIMPKYADDDANTLADHIMYLFMKQDTKNLDLLLNDYMGAKAKQFGDEVTDFVNERIKEFI